MNQQDFISFKNFYETLNKKHIFYMFFTHNYLYYVWKNIQFIPRHINLVLISAGLSKDEIIWIREKLPFPHFNFKQHMDDRKALDILLNTNIYHFGWLHIDCFAFNQKLFEELTKMDDITLFHSIWSFQNDGDLNFEFAHTYFLYFNVDIFHIVRNAYPNISTSLYTYPNQPLDGIDHNIINSEQIAQIKKKYAVNCYPICKLSGMENKYFDTLNFYQLIASTMGYVQKKIRNYNNLEDINRECVHIGCSSYFISFRNPEITTKREQDKYNLNVWLSYLILKKYRKILPQEYLFVYKYFVTILKQDHVPIHKVEELFVEKIKQNNIDTSAISMLIS